MQVGIEAEVHNYRNLFDGPATESDVHRHLTLLMNSLDIAVFWKDLTSTYVAGNVAFAEAAGLRPDEIAGKVDAQMPWAIEHGAASSEVDRQIIETGEPVLNVSRQVLLADGQMHWITLHKVPVRSASGEIIGVLGNFRDVTKWHNADIKLQETLADLDDRVRIKTKELVRANESMRREVEERVRLQAQEHQLREYAEAMRDTLAEMTEAANLEEVFDSVISGILRMLPTDLVAIVLPRFEGDLEIMRKHVSFGYSIDPAATTHDRLSELARSPVSTSSTKINKRSLGPAASSLVMPMRVGGRNVGYLTVESRIRNLYSDSHIERLHSLAASAAAMVANHQLAQQASMVGAARERDRLARSLHESLSQTIWSLSVTAEAGVASATGREEALAVLERIQALTQEAKVAMRALLSNEEFSLVGSRELHVAIRELVKTSFSGNGFTVSLDLEPIALSPERATGLFRIVQEALNNIARHANATIIQVSMHNAEQPLIQITDNGDGFDPDVVLPGHMGLEIIRRRTAEIGGILDLRSVRGSGTSLTITLTG